MNLKEAINKVIKMCNKTQKEVAEDIGTSQGALSTMLVRNNMQVSTLIKICEAMDYEVVLRPTKGTNVKERTVVIDTAGKES